MILWLFFAHIDIQLAAINVDFELIQDFVLTHSGRDKIAPISQTTFSNAFFLMKM